MLLRPPRPAAAAAARGAAAAAAPQPHGGLAPLDARSLALRGAQRAVATSCTHWLALNGPNTEYTQDIKHELSKQVRAPAPRGAQQLYLAQILRKL